LKLEGAEGYIIRRGRFMRGGSFFFTTEMGLGTRNQREGKKRKLKNGSKAVKALSFIFTVSVLNSSLAYVTVT